MFIFRLISLFCRPNCCFGRPKYLFLDKFVYLIELLNWAAKKLSSSFVQFVYLTGQIVYLVGQIVYFLPILFVWLAKLLICHAAFLYCRLNCFSAYLIV